MSVDLDWPEEKLGLPTIADYGIEPQEGVLRTDMATGAARQRRRFTTTPTLFPGVLLLTRYQLAIFEGWYYNDAAEGAVWFNITLLSGLGLVTHEARFKGQYKSTPWNGDAGNANAELWRVEVTFEVRNRPVLDADATALVLDSDPLALFATIDALVHLIDHELPTP